MASATEPLRRGALFYRSLHPLFRDFALTAGAEVAVLLAGFAVISILGRFLGAVALGEYLLLRRVLAWLQTGGQLGLGVALPRYVANGVTGPERDRKIYLCVSLLLIFVATAVIAAVLALGRVFFAGLFFGTPRATPLVLALTVLLAGLGAHVAVYGYYRGLLAMGWANALQLWNLGLVPIVTVTALLHTGSVALMVFVMGAAVLVSSLAVGLPVIREVWRSVPAVAVPVTAQLLRYGITRVPGDFCSSAMFALGPVVAAHYLPLSQVAYLLLGLSIMAAVSVSAQPVGIVLLSKVTMMLAQGRREEVRTHLKQFFALTIELPVFIALQLLVFAGVLVRVWVGPRFMGAIPVIRILVIAIPFYLLFIALRSVVNAASVTAYNTHNTLLSAIAFLVFLGMAVKLAPPSLLIWAIAAALTASLALLAWLTARTVQRLYDLRLNWSGSALPLSLAGLLGAAGYAVQRAQRAPWGVAETCAIEAIMFALFLGGLRLLSSTWLTSVWQFATGWPGAEVR
ncbi:MAG: lipopolysaccharide biosynthesis protein [Terriglobia bacterium]